MLQAILNRLSIRAARARANRVLRRATAHVALHELEGRRLMANPAVTGVTLFNAATDKSIGSVSKGATITVDLKTSRSINFRADATSAASVRFGYDGNTNFRTEGSAPFAFAGNSGNDYSPFTPSVGNHTVSVRAYAGANGSSTASTEYKFNLKVIDSSLSPNPSADNQTAYLGTPQSIPSQTVLFDNFDNGGEGVAYHDTSASNVTGQYRTNVGVDIEPTTDAAPSGLPNQNGVGRNIGHTRAGEWLEYTVNIAAAGTYKLQLRFASANNGGVGHFEVDGANVTGPITLGYTGGWQTWKTIEKAGVNLPAGQHVLKFVVDQTNSGTDIGNLHWFRFTADSTPDSPPPTQNPGSLKWPTSWQQTNDAPSPRYESSAHSFNGKLYVFGGFKDDRLRVDRTYVVYNPSNNTWTNLGTLPSAMAETHFTPVDDGKYIYFAGGFKGDLKHDGSTPTQTGSNLVWRFDPSNNTWSQLPNLPHAQGAAGAAIVGGKLHLIGGNPADRVTNIGEHWVLDLNNTGAGWKSAKPTPDPKDHPSTVVLNNKIYVIGGEYGHDKLGDTQSSMHVYDPATDSWTKLANMPFPSGHAESSTFVLNGYIIFAGGQTTGQQATNRVAAYNPATNKWSELKALPNYLQGTIVQPFGNKIIVTMGARWTEQPLRNTYIGYI